MCHSKPAMGFFWALWDTGSIPIYLNKWYVYMYYDTSYNPKGMASTVV